jgi:hypothetical protein
MPVPAAWVAALRSRHRVKISSTPALLARVQQRRIPRVVAGIPMKPLAIVPGFDPPRYEEFHLAELLHALGEITTPPVPNYADLSATWAVLRYVWAFDRPPAAFASPLTLSATARTLDFHQKTLLSDQMGVAFAALVMNECFAMPEAIDVSIALRDPAWFLAPPATRRSPDYLFHDGTPNGPVFVVECKGNQTSFNETVHQLQSGSEQVQSISFANGRASTPFVIATCLRQECEVFLLDPPPDKPPPPPRDFGSHKAHEFEPRKWSITDPEKFSRELGRLQAAKLLTFAGDYDEAFRVVGAEMPATQRQLLGRRGRHAVRENEFGTFEGRIFQTSLPDGTPVKAFRGILRELKQAIIANPEGATAQPMRKTTRGRGVTIAEVPQPRRGASVATVSGSGATLELTIG